MFTGCYYDLNSMISTNTDEVINEYIINIDNYCCEHLLFSLQIDEYPNIKYKATTKFTWIYENGSQEQWSQNSTITKP